MKELPLLIFSSIGEELDTAIGAGGFNCKIAITR